MMDERTHKNDGFEDSEHREIFSKAVRAGKRTYFFDVKATKRNDYFLTITESKKRFQKDGRFFFEKHKIFLYKEDFEKFMEGLNESIEVIKENAPPIVEREAYDRDSSYSDKGTSSVDDVNFDDLGK